jgi:hypothetical protein
MNTLLINILRWAVLFIGVYAAGTLAATTERVSVDSSGVEGNNLSYTPDISDDGRYVTFYSLADNLVAGDSNNRYDIFVHGRDTGNTQRVSVDSNGMEGDSTSNNPAINGDGRFVAFHSLASNLVSGDSNNSYDIFVHDRDTGYTERVSIASNGVEGDSDSHNPAFNDDGRYVTFQSKASNLVAGDSNGTQDIFVHDRDTGYTERVSVDSSGVQGNSEIETSAISADGRYVTFQSKASNLVSGDSNGTDDIFVHDRDTDNTTRVSVDSNGLQGDRSSYRPDISDDGRYVAFYSLASNLVAGDSNYHWDVFVHDRDTGYTERVSVDSSGVQGNSGSYSASISGDGRYVTFHSLATNLVVGDSNNRYDSFVHDRDTGITERVSVDSSAVQGNGASNNPAISGDGSYVAFYSSANNLLLFCQQPSCRG